MASSETTPLEIFESAEGKSITDTIVQGIAGWLTALSLAFISGVQVVADFLLLPFTEGIKIGVETVDQLILTPLGLTDFGLVISAQELPDFGILALPVSSGLALGTIGVLIAFLALAVTGNFPTSLITDNPIVDFFTTTPEEEFDDED